MFVVEVKLMKVVLSYILCVICSDSKGAEKKMDGRLVSTRWDKG